MSGIIGVSPDMRSGVVGKFPDGHILQVQGNTAAAVNNLNSNPGSVITQEITLHDYVNNDVLICVTGYIIKDVAVSGPGTNWGSWEAFVVGGSLGTGINGVKQYEHILYQQTENQSESMSISHWDKTPDEAVCTYGLFLERSNIGNAYRFRFSMSVYEIER